MSVPLSNSFHSNRRFELWHYRGFHWQFLFRSPPTSNSENNIDVIFKGVTFIQVEPGLIGISIRPATLLERSAFSGKRILHSNNTLYAIESQNHQYWIVASTFLVYSNGLGLSEIPLDAVDERSEVPSASLGIRLAQGFGRQFDQNELSNE